MSDRATILLPPPSPKLGLKTYSPRIEITGLTVGIDNIHFDVFLSPRFTDAARQYLLKTIRQISNLTQVFGHSGPPMPTIEGSAFRRLLSELLHQSLTQAKYEKSLDRDILIRVALLKFLTEEIGAQFANLALEGKEWVRSRGQHFEHSEQGHVLKARLADFQSRRKEIFRQVGQNLYQMLLDIEEINLAKTRRALLGDDFAEIYGVLKNRLVFAESGKDDHLFLEHYVLVGNYVRDPDRFQAIDDLLVGFVKEFVLENENTVPASADSARAQELSDRVATIGTELSQLEEQRDSLRAHAQKGEGWLSSLTGQGSPARAEADLKQKEARIAVVRKQLEDVEFKLADAKHRTEFLAEQEKSRLGVYLNEPENARPLFQVEGTGLPGNSPVPMTRRLEEWIQRLESSQMLPYILASLEVRQVASEYCPPLHLQQLKRALINKEELKQVEDILKQLPAKQLSVKRIEEAGKRLRRLSRDQTAAAVLQFTEGFMRLRRGVHDYQRLAALMERVHLVRNEKTRELSRLNNSLYECLMPDEARPAEDRVVSHAIIKADVRGSTRITQELLAKGLNPAAHFSLNLHEPVKRLLESYGAAKVFIEGDAIVLAIFESESNRAYQRAVAKACVLSRQILSVSRGAEARSETEGLPSLELGVGIAFQGSAPTYWVDGESRIMISRALNHSDRLSGCSKAARRVLAKTSSPFNVFLLQTVIEGATEEEAEEFLIRYNLNGIELNEEGFTKLSEEISLHALEIDCLMPWGRERVPLFYGELPMGEGLQSIVIRKGTVRELRPGGQIGDPLAHEYYEVCTSPSLLELVESRIEASALQN